MHYCLYVFIDFRVTKLLRFNIFFIRNLIDPRKMSRIGLNAML